jgi:hypothetical protein
MKSVSLESASYKSHSDLDSLTFGTNKPRETYSASFLLLFVCQVLTVPSSYYLFINLDVIKTALT